jgi:hypothetical protein
MNPRHSKVENRDGSLPRIVEFVENFLDRGMNARTSEAGAGAWPGMRPWVSFELRLLSSNEQPDCPIPLISQEYLSIGSLGKA